MCCLFSTFMTYSTSSCHFGKLFNPWNLCVCRHVSLQSYSKLVFRNKIIDNFEDFSLLLFSHRICPASENILSQRTYVATHYSVKSGIQCLPVFFTNAGCYWFLEAFNSIQFISLSKKSITRCKPHGYRNSQRVHLYIQSYTNVYTII
jgi:hypothetical protein